MYKLEYYRRAMKGPELVKSDVKEIKDGILERLKAREDYLTSYGEYEVIPVLSQIIKCVNILVKLDHGIENKNEYIPASKRLAKKAHFTALRIQSLLPALMPNEYIVARDLLMMLDIPYLNVLSDSIKYDVPNGYWWQYMYREVDDMIKQNRVNTNLEIISHKLKSFNINKLIRDKKVPIHNEDEVEYWSFFTKFTELLDKELNETKLINGAIQYGYPSLEFDDINMEDIESLIRVDSLSPKGLKVFNRLEYENEKHKHKESVFKLIEFCSDDERMDQENYEVDLNDFFSWLDS